MSKLESTTYPRLQMSALQMLYPVLKSVKIQKLQNSAIDKSHLLCCHNMSNQVQQVCSAGKDCGITTYNRTTIISQNSW